MTGNDPIRTEVKYGNISTVKFYGLLLLTSNFPFPIDSTDFSAQYRRVINLHMEKVISHKNKKEAFAGSLSMEVVNFLFLSIILQCRMNDFIAILNQFNLVELLHVNNESKYKLRHSPDPINLVNFVYDRMYSRDESKAIALTKITIVHQVACLFTDYLVKSKGLNIPIDNVETYNSEFNRAMNVAQPFG